MKNEVIFVGGIHGVGKTYFCKGISEKYNINSYSASKLISKIRDELFSSNKRIKNIDKNQDVLIEALRHLMDQEPYYLLDGHFCLLDERSRITRVPEQTFVSIAPKAIITLRDSTEKIINRLRKRDDQKYTEEFIHRFQKEELDYSLYIAKKLQVPYLEHYVSEDSKNVLDFIDNLLAKPSKIS